MEGSPATMTTIPNVPALTKRKALPLSLQVSAVNDLGTPDLLLLLFSLLLSVACFRNPPSSLAKERRLKPRVGCCRSTTTESTRSSTPMKMWNSTSSSYRRFWSRSVWNSVSRSWMVDDRSEEELDTVDRESSVGWKSSVDMASVNFVVVW